VPRTAAPLFIEGLDEGGLAVAAFQEPATGKAVADGLWRIELLHAGQPDRRHIASALAALAAVAGIERLDVTTRRLPERDWLAETAAQFPPQRVGRFWVHGSHIQARPPAGTVPIHIDAGLAFGSGEHATTRGCLQAVDRIAKRRRFRRVLDLGSGSGILGIAAGRCWPACVLAVDDDPAAVEVTRINAMRNGVGSRLRPLLSDGLSNPVVRVMGGYDLILANLLARPLIGLAGGLARTLAPRGRVVLSGLLARQASRVAAAYRAHGLRLESLIEEAGWVTLVMAHRRKVPADVGKASTGPAERARSRRSRDDVSSSRGRAGRPRLRQP
jgi:ribosomal protein L11 methyltransferase